MRGKNNRRGGAWELIPKIISENRNNTTSSTWKVEFCWSPRLLSKSSRSAYFSKSHSASFIILIVQFPTWKSIEKHRSGFTAYETTKTDKQTINKPYKPKWATMWGSNNLLCHFCFQEILRWIFSNELQVNNLKLTSVYQKYSLTSLLPGNLIRMIKIINI